MGNNSADQAARSENPEVGQTASVLFPLVYEQLRHLARQRMSDERDGHTLQATALVHEVYLRLAGRGNWSSRTQFYFAAAEAMRRIFIDHARATGARGA